MSMVKKKEEKNKLFSFKYFIYDFARWFLGWPIIIWFRLKKIYVSKEAKKHVKGPLLIVSNHVGMQDPFIIHIAYMYRRPRFSIAKEFYKTKFGSWIFKNFLCFPIDRDNVGFGALNAMGNELKKGGAVVIFPEGHINLQENSIDTFKSGVTLLAYRYNSPIQMIYYQKAKHWWLRTKIVVSEVIDVKSMVGNRPTPDKIKEVSGILFDKLATNSAFVRHNNKVF